MSLRHCCEPGCYVLVRGDIPRCPKHRKQSSVSRSGSRDPFYSRAPWRKLRKRFLAKNPLCAVCFTAGRVKAATDVHHMKPKKDHPELALTMSNLEGLCRSCHSRITRRASKGSGGRSSAGGS